MFRRLAPARPAPGDDARGDKPERGAHQHQHRLRPLLGGAQRQRLHAQVEHRLQPLARHQQRRHQRHAGDRLRRRGRAFDAGDVPDARFDLPLMWRPARSIWTSSAPTTRAAVSAAMPS